MQVMTQQIVNKFTYFIGGRRRRLACLVAFTFFALNPIASATDVAFYAAIGFQASHGPMAVCSADFDGDGDIDLATANFPDNSVSVLKNQGNGTFDSPVHFAAGYHPSSISALDMDKDGDQDVVVANEDSETISILSNNGSGIFETPISMSVRHNPYCVYVADLDADTWPDIVVACVGTDSVAVLGNSGNGYFDTADYYQVGGRPYQVIAADIDSDDDLDLATSNNLSNSVSVLMNQGNGDMSVATNYPVGSQPQSISAADLNADETTDLVAANWGNGNISILMNNGSGNFSAAASFPVGDFPVNVCVNDLNGDGLPDIAVANFYANTVTLLKNEGVGIFSFAGSLPVGVEPRWISAADLNGDTRPDLAVGNARWDYDVVSVLRNRSVIPITCSEQQALFCDDFEGGMNEFWTISGPNIWQAAGGIVSASLSGIQVHSYLVVEDTTWTDYTFEFDVIGNAGVEKTVGLRHTSERPGYGFSIRSDWNGDEAILHRIGNGVLQITNYPSQNGEWYHVKVKSVGNHITVSIDGTTVIDYVDVSNSCPNGGIFLSCNTGDAGTCDLSFDNVIVRAIYSGPTWYVATNGDDMLGDGSSASPFATIQRGINAAADNDTVLVGPGTYTQPFDYMGKAIYVKSEFGPDSAIFTSSTPIATLVSFHSSEDTLSVLDGFTFSSIITSGSSIGTGIVSLQGSSGTIKNCRFLSNTAVDPPGGMSFAFHQIQGGYAIIEDCEFRSNEGLCGPIYVAAAQGRIRRNVFSDNTAMNMGGALVIAGIYQGYGPTTYLIENNLFLRNSALHLSGASGGGAIWLSENSNTTVRNNTFVENSDAGDDGGSIGVWFSCSNITIENNNFIGSDGYAVSNEHESSVTLDCNNAFGNLPSDYSNTLAPGPGSISVEPLFCDTAAGDYRIWDISPCAPANNSCGVLIGAYGIGCANFAPVLTSGDSAQAVSGLGFVYKATSTDVDGPSTTYSFIDLPSWLTASGDSAFGIPPLTEIDTSFMVIVSDGFLADSLTVTVEITESPVVSALTTEGVAIAMNVISQTPTFGWQYFDATGSNPQTQFEIAVGSDSDWTHSELWNPAPFSGDATSRQYAGAALEDGQTYWVRARVRNALIWSNWKQTSFRMNSVPGVPEQRLPVDNSIVNTEHPTLVVRNPSDAENDSMLITFELSADSFATSIFPVEVKVSSDSLTSFWVNFPLNEDLRFWWRVKASDYYEESDYSPIWSFWINSVNTAPTAFSLLSPPNGSSPALPGNLPEFTWENSLDFDPWDSVEFTLQLAIDPSFSFLSQISGLTSPNFLTTTPLEWGRRYWWRVKAEDKSTGVRWSNETFDFKIMALGDADGSGTVTISDVVYLINYIFGGGAAPNPIESGDADCSGAVTISDVVYLINFIFAGTAAPCEG